MRENAWRGSLGLGKKSRGSAAPSPRPKIPPCSAGRGEFHVRPCHLFPCLCLPRRFHEDNRAHEAQQERRSKYAISEYAPPRRLVAKRNLCTANWRSKGAFGSPFGGGECCAEASSSIDQASPMLSCGGGEGTHTKTPRPAPVQTAISPPGGLGNSDASPGAPMSPQEGGEPICSLPMPEKPNIGPVGWGKAASAPPYAAQPL